MTITAICIFNCLIEINFKTKEFEIRKMFWNEGFM